MNEQVKLIASPGARLKYFFGYRSTKFAIAGALMVTLAGGVVWQYPVIESKFFEITGLQTPAEVTEAELVASERARLEASLSDSTSLIESLTNPTLFETPLAALQSAATEARSALRNTVTSNKLRSARVVLNRAMGELETARDAETKRQAEADRVATEQAEAARIAAEAQQAAAAAAAQSAAAATPRVPGGSSPSSGSGQNPAPAPAPAPALATSSLTVSCSRPESVTFAASGGGSVTLSAAGQSTSGSGSASLTVQVSGAVTATATGSGSASVYVVNGLTWCSW